MTLFSAVTLAPRDPILGLNEAFNSDPRSGKINLGVGVYFDEDGRIPLLQAVSKAQQSLLAAPAARGYLPIDGLPAYNQCVQHLLLGEKSELLEAQRVVTCQALGGTGALKIGADFLKTLLPDALVAISDPSWENHRALFGGAGFKVQNYRYCHANSQGVDLDGMLEDLRALPPRSVVLLHACCHNPTGVDLSADDWQALMQAACQKRQSQWGKQISYSRKVFIPLTNLCRDRCGYCTFVKQPGQCGAGYLSPDEVMAIVRRGEQLGCKEALFSLGEKPELRYPEARLMLADLGYASTLDYLVAMCQRVLQESALIPHINCGTASIEELVRIKEVCASFGIMLESVSQRLLHKGGAHHACPDKVPKRRLATLEAAGELNLPTTSGILMGIGETWAERIDSLYALAELHARFGHIQEVIVQNFRAKAGTAMAQHPEPTMDDMLQTLHRDIVRMQDTTSCI